MQDNTPQAEINLRNEDNRQTQEATIGEPQNQDGRSQLSSRYEQYCFAKRHLGGWGGREVFSFGSNSEPTSISSIHTGTLTSRYPASQREGTYIEETRKRAGEIEQINQPKHSNDRVYGADGISPTLNTMQGGNRQPFIAEEMRIRRLTPTECERLQAYPDGWTEGVSDTQRYKTLGNGVTVNVVAKIIKRLLL